MSRSKISYPSELWICTIAAGLVLLLGLGIGSLFAGFFTSPVFCVWLGLLAASLIGLISYRVLAGPRKFLHSTGSKRKCLQWQDLTNYLGGGIVSLGILTICGAAAWSFFSRHQEMPVTEGETRLVDPKSTDSLFLFRIAPVFFPGSASAKTYQTLVKYFSNDEQKVDTIGINDPLRTGSLKVYLVGQGISEDSIYLYFTLRLPQGDTIRYEFPAETADYVDNPYFPFLIWLEDFTIDSTHIWPNPAVPEVTVNLRWRDMLVASERLRAPDSLLVGEYTLFFHGFLMRRTANFIVVRDRSWIAALAGASLVFVGLAGGMVVRISKDYGGRGA